MQIEVKIKNCIKIVTYFFDIKKGIEILLIQNNKKLNMAEILGLGGIFIRSVDKDRLVKWYKDVLGVNMEAWGGAVLHISEIDNKGYQVFSVFKNDNDYYPTSQHYMLNWQVDNLEEYMEQLKSKGIEILGTEKSDYGHFAWIHDIDGNKIELWQSPVVKG